MDVVRVVQRVIGSVVGVLVAIGLLIVGLHAAIVWLEPFEEEHALANTLESWADVLTPQAFTTMFDAQTELETAVAAVIAYVLLVVVLLVVYAGVKWVINKVAGAAETS